MKEKCNEIEMYIAIMAQVSQLFLAAELMKLLIHISSMAPLFNHINPVASVGKLIIFSVIFTTCVKFIIIIRTDLLQRECM